MQQNSTTQPVITTEEIEKLVGTNHAQLLKELSPLTLTLLNDEYSEDNIKEKLAEVLHSKNGKEPSQDEIESLYQSLKKIAKKLQNNE